MDPKYHPRLIEPKWQKCWNDHGLFDADHGKARERHYVLEMFPYPSGNLHMGHVRAYVIGDVLARYYRMQGFDVLHPMGWDSLGLPAENAAIRDGIHPKQRTEQNIKSVRRQMKSLGLSLDWSREIATCDPSYYRWNQWFFIKMYERGLVYRRTSLANWCTGCLTVLANEQVVDGICERCNKPVVQRQIPDWAFRITRYADELLDDLGKLNLWPERIVSMQRNWIGRSEGVELRFPIKDNGSDHIEIFTTRADTVYGATYVVLAPEHAMVAKLTRSEQKSRVEAFVAEMSKIERARRTDAGAKKEGVWTGSYAINPFTGEEIPIWIANFVLADYGTGAVMSVPAHDQRDYEFAKQYGLPIRIVIQPQPSGEVEKHLACSDLSQAFTEDGVLYQSEKHTGLSSAQARIQIAKQAERQGIGGITIRYHLRDWGISRQRYWGTPIPMVHCEVCGIVPVPIESLPVLLPEQAPITGTGEAPLAKVPEFVNTDCPKCGKKARRETDTMDTFVDSSWYFARYLDPGEEDLPFKRESADRWLPVKIYVGGPEHAVMHLLYFRFWTKVMRDMGLVSVDEPVERLLTQGMVVGESFWCESHGYRSRDGVDDPESSEPKCTECGRTLRVRLEKMSKSKLNGVAPESMCEQYGADTARLFSLFAAPPEKDVEWNDRAVAGCYNFLRRIWVFFLRHHQRVEGYRDFAGPLDESGLSLELIALHRSLHRTIAKVTADIEKEFQFNTAIAALMELLNGCKVLDDEVDGFAEGVDPDRKQKTEQLLFMVLKNMVLLLSPFAPHVADELWKNLGMSGFAGEQPWPKFDPQATQEDTIQMAVQVNGKVRATIDVQREASEDEIRAQVEKNEKVQKWLEGKSIRRVIVVPGRLVNIVVG